MIISVAGNISSGKTTLAKKICSLYDFTYVPSKRNELKFLDDFFENIPEYFFATQTSFLINKVSEIDEKRKSNNIVIDRSLYEDIHVFAQLWMDNYSIDEKEKVLYKSLAEYLIKTIPKTDIYILCNCEKKVLLERFNFRTKRTFEEKYPHNYIQQLCDRYDSIKLPNDAVVVEIDTSSLDVRDDNTVIDIMSYIFEQVNKQNYEQLSLFDSSNDVRAGKSITNPYVKVMNGSSNLVFAESTFNVKKKQIYLAAPFTEFATEEPVPKDKQQLLVDINIRRDYNILPKKYQSFLNKIKKLLSCNGEFDIILPHKDENNWGRTYISNDQIVEAMINNMKRSHLIVAIISNSIGVHMEIAMMSIQNKPMVLIVLDNFTTGFYANGFRKQQNVLVLHVSSIDNVYEALNDTTVLEFIRRNLSDEKVDRE